MDCFWSAVNHVHDDGIGFPLTPGFSRVAGAEGN
jgi:hypothetical protein